MENEQILEKLIVLLREIDTAGKDCIPISLEDKLTDLGVTSKNFVKLCIEIEDIFHIHMTLQDMDFDNKVFTTVESMLDYIRKKICEEIPNNDETHREEKA